MTSVGLVLGAGGIVGAAWHAGVLAALVEETGWDARSADLIVGTSAGSGIGASLRAGLSPADQFARATDAPLSTDGDALLGDQPNVRQTIPSRPPPPDRVPRPASPRVALASILRPWPPRPMAAFAGLLPEGRVSGDEIGGRIRDIYDGQRWPDEPLWICAVHLDSGERVVLGRDEHPAVDIGAAVQASSAIPGFFTPVEIGGQRYVDGGVHSPTNADLLTESGFDVVVVSSPMSATRKALRRLAGRTPSATGRLLHAATLGREIRRLRAAAVPVLVIQPTADDVTVLGVDAMDAERRGRVARQARDSALGRLKEPGTDDAALALLRSAA